MTQEVLIIVTANGGLRSDAHGWSYEDPSFIDQNKFVGLSPSNPHERFYAYDCVAKALNDGWKLLAPPYKSQEGWEWWLVRDEL